MQKANKLSRFMCEMHVQLTWSIVYFKKYIHATTVQQINRHLLKSYPIVRHLTTNVIAVHATNNKHIKLHTNTEREQKTKQNEI